MKLTRFVLTALVASGSLAACGGGTEPAAAQVTAAAIKDTASTGAPAAAAAKINANSATEAELMTIPGVGKEIAHEIEEYRPYDAASGEARFRKELAKYIPEGEIEKIIAHLEFS